jgi:hypothetical protein
MAGTGRGDGTAAARSRVALTSETIGAYQRALGWELRDLPRRQRLALMRDAKAHLIETGGSDPATLGTPEQWAHEYRAALDLPKMTRRDRLRSMPLVTKIGLVATPLLIAAVIVGVVSWLHYQPVTITNYGGRAPGAGNVHDVEFGTARCSTTAMARASRSR